MPGRMVNTPAAAHTPQSMPEPISGASEQTRGSMVGSILGGLLVGILLARNCSPPPPGSHVDTSAQPRFLEKPQALPAALIAPSSRPDPGELLRDNDGNISPLARRLGVSRNTLYKRLRACKTDR